MSMNSSGRSPICTDWSDHEFVEVYYGDECAKCGLFFAFGCAPWDAEEKEMYEQGYL